jgi:hypothetical protein
MGDMRGARGPRHTGDDDHNTQNANGVGTTGWVLKAETGGSGAQRAATAVAGAPGRPLRGRAGLSMRGTGAGTRAPRGRGRRMLPWSARAPARARRGAAQAGGWAARARAPPGRPPQGLGGLVLRSGRHACGAAGGGGAGEGPRRPRAFLVSHAGGQQRQQAHTRRARAAGTRDRGRGVLLHQMVGGGGFRRAGWVKCALGGQHGGDTGFGGRAGARRGGEAQQPMHVSQGGAAPGRGGARRPRLASMERGAPVGEAAVLNTQRRALAGGAAPRAPQGLGVAPGRALGRRRGRAALSVGRPGVSSAAVATAAGAALQGAPVGARGGAQGLPLEATARPTQ